MGSPDSPPVRGDSSSESAWEPCGTWEEPSGYRVRGPGPDGAGEEHEDQGPTSERRAGVSGVVCGRGYGGAGGLQLVCGEGFVRGPDPTATVRSTAFTSRLTRATEACEQRQDRVYVLPGAF